MGEGEGDDRGRREIWMKEREIDREGDGREKDRDRSRREKDR